MWEREGDKEKVEERGDVVKGDEMKKGRRMENKKERGREK